LSVYATARQYGSLSPESTYADTFDSLTKICHEMIDRYVIEQVLRPLARTIAMK
jgi:hypothetical protein